MGGTTVTAPGAIPAAKGKTLREQKDEILAGISKALDVLIDAEEHNPIYSAQAATKFSIDFLVTYPAGRIGAYPEFDLTKNIADQIGAQPVAEVKDNIVKSPAVPNDAATPGVTP